MTCRRRKWFSLSREAEHQGIHLQRRILYMAFFKFRWPGQPSQLPTGDQAERTAWHRMIGTVVLVTSLLTVISWLLDTTPRDTVPQVTIELPNRNEVPPLPLPSVTVADGLDPDEQIITDPPPNTAPIGEPPAFQELPDDDPEAAIQPPPLPVPVAPPLPIPLQEPIPVAVPPPPVTPPAVASTPNVQPASPKPVPPKKPASKPPAPVLTEADRARALLEGKIPVVPEAQRAQALLENRPIASATVPKTGPHVVQAGVYFADKVQAVRDRLERAGFKTYVEEVRLKEGKTGLRVRVGPFTTDAEAKEAAKRIRSMGLEAVVIAQ